MLSWRQTQYRSTSNLYQNTSEVWLITIKSHDDVRNFKRSFASNIQLLSGQFSAPASNLIGMNPCVGSPLTLVSKSTRPAVKNGHIHGSISVSIADYSWTRERLLDFSSEPRIHRSKAIALNLPFQRSIGSTGRQRTSSSEYR